MLSGYQMIDIVEIKERPIREKVTYFRYKEPQQPDPYNWFGMGMEEYGTDYRGFMIVRRDRETTLYEIKTKEDGIPPIPLRGSFTSQGKCMYYIDQFHRKEELEKEKAKAEKAKIKAREDRDVID
jgi:hypothetical protein